MRILRELLFRPNARFSDLNISDLPTDQFTYHLKRLIQDRYVKKNNKEYMLVQRRKKQPYYNFIGFVSGKVKYGETVIEAAAREFFEETNLHATMSLRFVLHEHVYSSSKKLLEDKYFHVIHAHHVSGTLKNTREGENTWIAKQKLLTLQNTFYDEHDIIALFEENTLQYIEKSYVVDSF